MKTIKGDGFTVQVIKTNRRKTMLLKVEQQGVTIRIPSRLPLSFARDFIDEKSSWIKAKLEQQSQHPVLERQFIDGETVLLFGQSYSLQFKNAQSKPHISIAGNNIICHARLDKITKTAIRAAFIAWYKQQAQSYLTERSDKFSQQTGLQAQSITVKTYRARWGSCTLSGHIHYNWKLLMAPPDVIDYVIIHELCHTEHHNHSAAFWHLVETYMPDYRSARNWLKINGYCLEL
ncbi:MAG: SprT family zinc-dependent metalloprotease [Gammaproteobacteria bacterium]|nr:SprT family zinc-dependent metalloprotease [Gammaproteobacteria bacterium]